MSYGNVIPFRRREEPRPGAVPAKLQKPAGKGEVSDFDVQAFLPRDRVAPLMETGPGVHQVPHKIYEFIFKATSTKVEMLVFGCLVRFSLGYHRPACRCSLSFVAKWTGLAIPNVRKGIETLISKGLIVRKELGSHFDHPSLYEIPIVKAYLDHNQRQKISSKSEENLSPKNQLGNGEPLLNQSQYSNQNNPGTRLKSITKKESINTNRNKTLSLDDFLKSYFEGLKSKKKKRSEWEHFQEITKDGYSIQEITDALEYLLNEGIPQYSSDLTQGRIDCHSPMAFLATAMDRVLTVVASRKEKLRKRDDRRRLESQRKTENLQQEAAEESLFAEKMRLFRLAFPTKGQQEQYIEEFEKKNPCLAGEPFRLRNLAISAWYADPIKTK